MASDQDSEDEIDPILAQLEHVLDPLGPERVTEVMAWVRDFLRETPLLSYLCAEGEAGDVDWHAADAQHPGPWTTPKTYEFRLGAPSPIDPENTVFAIFHWYVQGIYVVYSFKAALLETGGALSMYTRDLVHKPRMASGIVTLTALYNDLKYHTDTTPWDDVAPEEDGPPEPPRPRAIAIAPSAQRSPS